MCEEAVQMDGQTDGQRDGWTDEGTDRRTDGLLVPSRSHCPHPLFTPSSLAQRQKHTF